VRDNALLVLFVAICAFVLGNAVGYKREKTWRGDEVLITFILFLCTAFEICLAVVK
jgi:hypothetical protein